MDDMVEKKSKSKTAAMNNLEVPSKHCISAVEVLKESAPFYTEPDEETPCDLNTYKAEKKADHPEELKVSEYQKWNAEEGFHGGDDIDNDGDLKTRLDLVERNSFGRSYYIDPTAHDNDTMKIHNQPLDAIFLPPISSALQYNYNFSHRSKLSTTTSTDIVTLAPEKCEPHGQVRNRSFHYPNMWYPNTPYNSGSFLSSYGANRFPHYGSTVPYQSNPMTDVHHLSNSGREARNRAEKNRRDKLNGSIQELSTMVPHVAESPRRVDKTAVLRFAAHGLRLQYTFRDTLNLSKPQLTDSLMKLLDSFFITLTCHGQIILISSSIEQHLGHCQIDLYGQNILSITHPEDHDLIRHKLIPSDLDNLFDIQPDGESCEPRQRTPSEEEYIDQKLREDKRCFTVRLARAGPRSEPTSYELVKLDGCFRRSDSAPRGVNASSSTPGLHLIRRTQRREDTIPLHAISGNDIVLVAIARVIRPPKLIKKIIEANGLEYKTRHLIDGRIIDCDQRIGVVAGYMTDEVKNLSPFTFMHQDDVRWVIVALRQMYDCNSCYGESTYRLLTRNGYFIYLQSKGYLEIDKQTNTVHSFVCVNTLLEEEEGKRRVDEMKKKFSVIINKQIPSSSVDVPASENPQQLVKAVLCLIQNLQKTSSNDAKLRSVSRAFNSVTDYPLSPLMPSSDSTYSSRSTKTPSLALVPPEPASVKTSISKSVSVVNVTAAKHLHGKKSQQTPSENEWPSSPVPPHSYETNSFIEDGSSSAFRSGCEYQNEGMKCDNCERISKERISPLKRSLDCSPEGDKDLKIIKRHFGNDEIQHVIFSSLDQLGRSLQEQKNAAIELKDQSDKYEVPNAKKRIKAIMEECQKQNEMYVTLTSEIQNQGNLEVNPTKVEPQ